MITISRMTAAIAPNTSHLGIVRAGSAASNTSACDGGEPLAAHFLAQLFADFDAVEADRAGITLRETDGVGRRREIVPVGRLDAFQMAKRNAGLGRNVLETQFRLLRARRAAVRPRSERPFRLSSSSTASVSISRLAMFPV